MRWQAWYGWSFPASMKVRKIAYRTSPSDGITDLSLQQKLEITQRHGHPNASKPKIYPAVCQTEGTLANGGSLQSRCRAWPLLDSCRMTGTCLTIGSWQGSAPWVKLQKMVSAHGWSKPAFFVLQRYMRATLVRFKFVPRVQNGMAKRLRQRVQAQNSPSSLAERRLLGQWRPYATMLPRLPPPNFL